jgi:hypothetical protein
MNWKKMVVASALAIVAVAAQAKDDAFLSDMVAMEKSYVNPLFYTSNMNAPKAKASYTAFVAVWDAFYAEYRTYRPSQQNWVSRFDAMNEAVQAPKAIIDQAAKLFAAKDPSCVALPTVPPSFSCPSLVGAHDILEAVRYELWELRTHNGFPRFVTDRLTAYHDPMEAIVLTFKGRPLPTISAAELAAVGEYLDEAIYLWTLVEKAPIDAELWGFSDAAMIEIEKRLAAESAMLEKLAGFYDAGDLAGLAANAMALKQAFVPVYTAFAGDPLLNKLPQ